MRTDMCGGHMHHTGGTMIALSAWRHRPLPAVAALLSLIALACLAFLLAAADRAESKPASDNSHLGVGSCSRSTCHGRQEPTGAVVRQDEILRWQDPTTPAGSHSRAWTVLGESRGRAIAAKLGIGDPRQSALCINCHSDPGPRAAGAKLSDGIGCEACHGGAQSWLAEHVKVDASHARNVQLGMRPLENASVRAGLCLDCHFGSAKPGQFVDHRIMAAGHPRISFELDLFSTLEQHWNEDADYARRKGAASNVKMWAVGQAAALERALGLFADAKLGTNGAFPEFYFFDCQTCHRRISDAPDYRPTAPGNPGRPVPLGTPAFQDENMIMLSAAATVIAPDLARKLDADSRAFHSAIAQDRAAALKAGATLRATAAQLADRFGNASISSAETLRIINTVATGAVSQRFTDYEGSVQAVMAMDTLLSALVVQGAVGRGEADAIRPAINRAYAAVRDANAYDPAGFRSALGSAASAIQRLK